MRLSLAQISMVFRILCLVLTMVDKKYLFGYSFSLERTTEPEFVNV
jgi:hypothetical protein